MILRVTVADEDYYPNTKEYERIYELEVSHLIGDDELHYMAMGLLFDHGWDDDCDWKWETQDNDE